MRSPVVLLPVVVVAWSFAGCGGPPVPVPPPPPPPPPAVTQVATCEDVGALLRGSISSDDDDPGVGASREALIVKLCTETRWSQAVIACVVGAPSSNVAGRACLERLDAEQLERYEDELVAWDDEHPGATEDDDGDGGDDDDLDAGMHDLEVACDAAILHVETWPPPVTTTGDDHALATALRRRALLALCADSPWDDAPKTCLSAATGTAQVGACLDLLETSERAAVVKRLAELDQVVARAAKLRKRATTHTCAKVAAAHYRDARWKQELPNLTAAERKRVSGESRKRMRDACTADKWSAAVRSCIVAGGDDACHDLATPARWSFPAPGVSVAIGVPECDAYMQAIHKMSTCKGLPQASRDALRDSAAQTSAAWANVPPEGRAALALACKSAMDALAQAASAASC